MSEYKDAKSGNVVTTEDSKEFIFPASGAKLLLKCRPPVAKEIKTD